MSRNKKAKPDKSGSYRRSVYCGRDIISLDGKSIWRKYYCSLREKLNKLVGKSKFFKGA